MEDSRRDVDGAATEIRVDHTHASIQRLSTLSSATASCHGLPAPPRALLLACSSCAQLIFSVFKTLTDQTVSVELKNDLSITGTLKSVDQYVDCVS